MLKYLGESVLMFTIYFKMQQQQANKMGWWMNR